MPQLAACPFGMTSDLLDDLERLGVRAGDLIQGLRRLEARGQVYSAKGSWRLAAATRAA